MAGPINPRMAPDIELRRIFGLDRHGLTVDPGYVTNEKAVNEDKKRIKKLSHLGFWCSVHCRTPEHANEMVKLVIGAGEGV